MDRVVRSELAEPDDPAGGSGILEERLELVAQARRREIPDEPHLDAPPREPRRVLLEAQAVARLVADPAEDPRRIVDEREVVQDAEHARLEVAAAAERVREAAEI